MKFPGKALTSKCNGIYCRLILDLSQEPLDLFGLSYSIRTWVRYTRNAVLRPGLWFFCVLGWLKFPLWAYLLTVMSSHDLTANESLPMCLDRLQCHLILVQIILVLGVNCWQTPPERVWEVTKWCLLTKHQLEERGLMGSTQALWVRARCEWCSCFPQRQVFHRSWSWMSQLLI